MIGGRRLARLWQGDVNGSLPTYLLRRGAKDWFLRRRESFPETFGCSSHSLDWSDHWFLRFDRLCVGAIEPTMSSLWKDLSSHGCASATTDLLDAYRSRWWSALTRQPGRACRGNSKFRDIVGRCASHTTTHSPSDCTTPGGLRLWSWMILRYIGKLSHSVRSFQMNGPIHPSCQTLDAGPPELLAPGECP